MTPTITWNFVPGSGRYILQVENVSNPGVAVIRRDNLTGTSFTTSSALTAGTYRAWIKAIDATSNAFSSGLWSRPFDFTVAASDADQTESLLNPDSGITLVSLPKQLQPKVNGNSSDTSHESNNATSQSAEVDTLVSPVTAGTSVVVHRAGQPGLIDPVLMQRNDDTIEIRILDAVMEHSVLMAAMFD